MERQVGGCDNYQGQWFSRSRLQSLRWLERQNLSPYPHRLCHHLCIIQSPVLGGHWNFKGGRGGKKMLKEGFAMGTRRKRYSLEGCLGRVVNSNGPSLQSSCMRLSLGYPHALCLLALWDLGVPKILIDEEQRFFFHPAWFHNQPFELLSSPVANLSGRGYGVYI